MYWIIVAIAAAFVTAIALMIWLRHGRKGSGGERVRHRTLNDVFGPENTFDEWDSFGHRDD